MPRARDPGRPYTLGVELTAVEIWGLVSGARDPGRSRRKQKEADEEEEMKTKKTKKTKNTKKTKQKKTRRRTKSINV